MADRYGNYPYGHGLNSGPNTAGIIPDQRVMVTAGQYRGCRGYRTTYPPPAEGLICVRLTSGLLVDLAPSQIQEES